MAAAMIGRLFHKKQKICNEPSASLRLGERLTDELIKEACSVAMNAHNFAEKLYVHKKYDRLSRVIFSFPGCWSVNDWFTGNAFGETKIDLTKFPSLKSLATEEVATANEAFVKRFHVILENIQEKVEKYVEKGKEIVFTGHSSGGAIAILVTVWFLQQHFKKPDTNNTLPPLCLTFGSPLVGDHIFNHALSRENWSIYFTHFVMRYDIVPRVLLAPPSSIEQQLIYLLNFLKPRSTLLKQESSIEASTLYESVMRNVSSVASHAACHLMGNTNNLSETLSIFVKLSPYRPSGTYVFCTEEELVVVKNPDSVMQILFYTSQSLSERELPGIAMRSIKDHQNYHSELQSLEKKNVTHLDSLKELPLSSNCKDFVTDKVLNNLGLSSRARLCLCAAREFEEQKLINQNKFDAEKKAIETRIVWLENYKARCENHKMSYYDAFKISRNIDDFNANVTRLELAGILDELMEMIKKHELPDMFEGNIEWIAILTRHRHIVEPLDIANYYRHGKNIDSNAYLAKGSRPKRYRFPQNWHEYAGRMETGSSWESCFWAEVEDLDIRFKNSQGRLSDDVKKRIAHLEETVKAWVSCKMLGRDVFFEDSTFIKWWETLPQQYRLESSFSGFISEQQKALKGV